TAAIHFLDKIFSNANSPDNLRAMALKTALHLELDKYIELATSWVKSSNEILALSALEYLAQFNPDHAYPYLGMHLKSKNPRLKVTALNILKRFDPTQSISTLFAILRSYDSSAQNLAMSCLVQFDFALIREQLVEFLLSSAGKKHINECVCLFQANPDPENLFDLYRIEKCLDPQSAKLVQEVRKQCEELLVKFGRISQDEVNSLKNSFGERFTRDEEKRKAPPPYAISRLQKGSSAKWYSLEGLYPILAEFFAQDGLVIAKKLAFALIIIGFPIYYVYPILFAPTDNYQIQQNRYSTLQSLRNPQLIEGWKGGSKKSSGGTGSSFSAQDSIHLELAQVQQSIRESEMNLREPPGLSEDGRMAYRASQNVFLNDALAETEEGNLDDAEALIFEAFKNDPRNPFLEVSGNSALCVIYQKRGDKKKYREAFRRYIKAIENLPGGLGASMSANISNISSVVDNLRQNLGKIDINPYLLKAGNPQSTVINSDLVKKGLNELDEMFPDINSEQGDK
ncbi:hypothetical protein HYY75_03350, partial [bacterium]|nr:hypothetical protein [bacterium]